MDKLPADWVPEQTILRLIFLWSNCPSFLDLFRSFQKSKLPGGFPVDYRQYARYACEYNDMTVSPFWL